MKGKVKMIWFCLFVIAIIAAIIFGIIEGYDIGEKILNAFVASLGVCCVGLIMLLVLNVMFYSPSDKLELTETQKIYSLKDNTYLSGYGNFISVRIEEDDKYTYMIVNEDGTYSKNSIESKNVRIKEVDDVEPILETYIRKSKNEFWSLYSEEHYCFVVPKGTVVNTFSIDLE